jgi:cyanate lyase
LIQEEIADGIISASDFVMTIASNRPESRLRQADPFR